MKRERWHAKPAGEGATCLGTSAEPQNDTCMVVRAPIFGFATTRKGSRKDNCVILNVVKDRLERQNLRT